MKQKLLLFLAAALLLACTACGGARQGDPPPSGSAGPSAALREIDVVLDWYPNALHAFLYEAIEKGYYEDEGLHVNIRFPSNANDAISLVAAGRAEIGLYYQQDVILARANQDVPVKSIGAVVQGPLNIVLSLEEKNISSPEDLAGKTVGYAGTELSEALVRSMMSYVGANPEDVSMVDVGFDLMSSMTAGNVDATIGCLINHEVPQLEEEGFSVQYFGLDSYGVPTYYEGVFLASRFPPGQRQRLCGYSGRSRRGPAHSSGKPERGKLCPLRDGRAQQPGRPAPHDGDGQRPLPLPIRGGVAGEY